MVLHHGTKQNTVRALLDTGCSVPLINQKTAAKLQIPLRKRENKRVIENFEAKTVGDAGSHYTDLMTLQHHHHYSWKSFKVSPMEAKIDLLHLKYLEYVAKWKEGCVRMTERAQRV